MRLGLGLGLVGVLVLACSGAPPPPPARADLASRPTTLRSSLPSRIQPLLPRRGLFAAGGGGPSSNAWRVVVDFDANTIYGGQARQPGTPSFGALDRESTKELSAPNEQHLFDLGQAAWSEVAPRDPPPPPTDRDEVLIVVEGDETFYLRADGGIRQPAAAKLIIELRAAGGL